MACTVPVKNSSPNCGSAAMDAPVSASAPELPELDAPGTAPPAQALSASTAKMAAKRKILAVFRNFFVITFLLLWCSKTYE